MSRFQIGDVIRHRTGVKLRLVTTPVTVNGMYRLQSDDHDGFFAEKYVDENFILVERRIQDEVITEDASHALKLQQEFMSGMTVDMETGFVPNYLFSMPRGAGKRSVMEKVAEFARGYCTDLNASAKTGRWVKAAPPFKIDPNAAVPEDVAVTLEGIPQGYYLKAFRPAGPADLIIETNGVICKEDCTYHKYYKGKSPLLRPIVAPIPDAKTDVPGIPAGYELVRIGTPRPGELFIDKIGGVATCIKQSESPYITAIVRKKINFSPCTGVLPGIPLGYKVVRFGDVSPEEFYFDTVGNLKQGPSKHRIVVEKRSAPGILNAAIDRIEEEMGAMSEAAFKKWAFDDSLTRNDAADAAAYAAGQLKQFEGHVHRVGEVTEYEYKLIQGSPSMWTSASAESMQGSPFITTGRTRKVKVIRCWC